MAWNSEEDSNQGQEKKEGKTLKPFLSIAGAKCTSFIVLNGREMILKRTREFLRLIARFPPLSESEPDLENSIKPGLLPVPEWGKFWGGWL